MNNIDFNIHQLWRFIFWSSKLNP